MYIVEYISLGCQNKCTVSLDFVTYARAKSFTMNVLPHLNTVCYKPDLISSYHDQQQISQTPVSVMQVQKSSSPPLSPLLPPEYPVSLPGLLPATLHSLRTHHSTASISLLLTEPCILQNSCIPPISATMYLLASGHHHTLSLSSNECIMCGSVCVLLQLFFLLITEHALHHVCFIN